MNQVRPYMRESVKSLEKVFSDYAFNKKVLTAVRAELKLRTTKSAAALLLKVQQRLEEIEKRDRFGAKAVRKVTPSATPSPSQLPLIDTPIVKLAHVERPVAPPTQPRPQPISTGASPKATASPLPRRSQHDSPVAADRPPQPTASPARQDAQAKVKAEADRAVSVSLIGLALLAVILLFAFLGKKMTDPVVHRAGPAPDTYKHVPLYTKPRVSPVPFDEALPQQTTRKSNTHESKEAESRHELRMRIDSYQNTVDALLN